MLVEVTWTDALGRSSRLAGRVSCVTLGAVSLVSPDGGQCHLSRPERGWSFTLERDFEQECLLPGTCATGRDALGRAEGLWLATYFGGWEVVRSTPGPSPLPDLASLRPVQLHQQPLPAEWVEGELALVQVAGHTARAIRWPGLWRIPALAHTTAAAEPLAHLAASTASTPET